MSKLKVGLIGLGRIGKVHLENLVQRIKGVQVVAVATPSVATHSFASDLGIKEIYQDASKVILHSSIEAIIICSPTTTHAAYIKMAAQAGKHIFCEKPLEMTIPAIVELIEITDRYAVKLQVGFNRRFDGDFRQVQQQVKNGSIGEPHILKITSRDPGPPSIEYLKSSGGMFMDMTIHDFDMARFVVGKEVNEVFAKAAVRVDDSIRAANDIDTAIITLKFEGGCLGVIDNSRKAVYGYDQRIEVFGSGGMSRIDNNTKDNHIFYDQLGSHASLPLNFFMERYTASYCEELREFVTAINENKQVLVGGKDALIATKIAMAANLSVQENRPVLLKEFDSRN